MKYYLTDTFRGELSLLRSNSFIIIVLQLKQLEFSSTAEQWNSYFLKVGTHTQKLIII